MSQSDSKKDIADPGRIRSSRACLHCSRRKVKCDGLQPCNNCSKDSTLCEYGAQKKRGPPKGCDPRGGRRKKVDESPSNGKPSLSIAASSSSKHKAMPSAVKSESAPRNSGTGERSFDQESPHHASTERTDLARPPFVSSNGESSSLQSATPSSGARPSPNARFDSDERLATTSRPPHESYTPSWSRSPGGLPAPTSSSPARRTTDLLHNAVSSASSSSHQLPQLQQHHQHHTDSYSPDHSWRASSADHRLPQSQLASTSRLPDAYPLQAPLREYHRSSPLASAHPTAPPHSTAADMSAPPSADRPTYGSPTARCIATSSALPYVSPRSHPGRSLYDGPGGHYQSGTSIYERNSATLASRHPVSASRLSDPASTSLPASAHVASSSLPHGTSTNTSPAFTGTSHGYSPSSNAVAHRPWYNGSRPTSPRDPASLPRSQVSSPGAHWLDHHVRPNSAAGNHALLSSASKIPLEDRLPPHIVQRLLDIYQTFVHPHWPIVYLPALTSLHSLKQSRPILFEAMLAVASNTFDAYADSSSRDGQQSANPVMEQIYASSPQSTEPAYKSNELRDHFVQRVKARIFEGKFTQDIATIQAAILLAVVELGCGNTSSAFQFGGIACRMALDMNLHRCTSASRPSAHHHDDSSRHDYVSNKTSNGTDASYPSAAQHEERLRVFWACYIMDKVLSTALDKPPQLRSAEIETDWPSVQETDEYDLWLNQTTRKFVDKAQLPYLEGVKVHVLSSFKAWAEVMAILERILEEVYSPQARRDRRRTKGASDYEALLRLNERLGKWRADLPSHLKWSGTWTSPELLSSPTSRTGSIDRRECEAHRGRPPHILTMRSWYCICLILLHRPRVPKLLEGHQDHGIRSSPDSQADLSPTKKRGQASSAANSKRPEPAGLDICNAAAKEVCDILHVYGTSFRIRKISSSWVYLIFQSATIHAALAASKSVVAFKARQSTNWSRRGSTNRLNEATDDAAMGDDADVHSGNGDAEAHRATEAELEGSSELVKTSALYLAECVRYLKRIGPTWQSASNHVAVLRNLCIASAQSRPISPSTQKLLANGMSYPTAQIKREGRGDESGFDHPQDSAAVAYKASTASGNGGGGQAQHQQQQQQLQPLYSTGHHTQHLYNGHARNDDAGTMNGFNTAPSNEAGSQGLQTQFLQQQGYGATQQRMLAPSGVPLHAQQQQQQQQQMMQQAMHSINANDSAFWAMMPVASEGYNEWDEFFKAFNPGVASQNANYHPTAAVDLITALQDPNRLLSGL